MRCAVAVCEGEGKGGERGRGKVEKVMMERAERGRERRHGTLREERERGGGGARGKRLKSSRTWVGKSSCFSSQSCSGLCCCQGFGSVCLFT